MKPKYLFWFCCVAFCALAIKTALAGERYLPLLAVSCALACAANAVGPSADKKSSWEEFKKMFDIH